MNKKMVLAVCFALLLSISGLFYCQVTYTRVSAVEKQIASMDDKIASMDDKIDSVEAKIDRLIEQTNISKGELTYQWASYDQQIINGTLEMSLSFVSNSLICIVNDDDYYGWGQQGGGNFGGDFLGLAFDKNNDSSLIGERIAVLYANNMSTSALLMENGSVVFDLYMLPSFSYIHTCTFKADVGYTLNVTILPSEGSGSLMYVAFHDYVEEIMNWNEVHVQCDAGF